MSSPLGLLPSGGGGGDQSLLTMLTNMASESQGYKGTAHTNTGIIEIVKFAKDQGLLSPATIPLFVPQLPGLFGGYPTTAKTEIGPDALFIALFGVLFIAYLALFLTNTIRKHNFYLYLGIAFFAALKIIGFATRIAWAHDITSIPLAICSVVFIQVAQLLLQGLNLILAHRIFTWHHPQTGYHWIVVSFIDILYFIVLAIIALAIVGQSLPYLYFMSEYHYHVCLNIMKAAGILNLVYSTLPFSFIIATYAIPVGSVLALPKIFNQETQEAVTVMPNVYQATWVKSANLFYYPEPNAQWLVYKGDPLDDAIRIIPSREPPRIEHKRVNSDDKANPKAPHLHWALVTVLVSSLVLTINTCFRVAATFRNGAYSSSTNKVNYWPHEPYVMFIFYGATEACVLAFYLLMRIDLRFYIPDMVRKLPKDVKRRFPDSELAEKTDFSLNESEFPADKLTLNDYAKDRGWQVDARQQ